MKKITLMSEWTEVERIPGDPDSIQRIPSVLVDHPQTEQGESYRDITMQPEENLNPNPNLFVAELIYTDQHAISVSSDSKYYILSEENV